MAQVLVRKLDPRVVDTLKTRAKIKGHSLEQELRLVLTKAAGPSSEEVRETARRIRAMTPRGLKTDTTAMLREDRDRDGR